MKGPIQVVPFSVFLLLELVALSVKFLIHADMESVVILMHCSFGRYGLS
jgi:hypothetical protein